MPLAPLALYEATQDQADKEAFANFGSFHNVIGKVHHRAVERFRDSGAQGIGSASEGRGASSYIPQRPTLGFEGPNRKDKLPWNVR